MNGQETAADWAIDARNVTKSFSGKIVVDDISIRVRRGEIFGFLGPNGSGKTTFIRTLCGLLRPDKASGTCLGLDINSMQAEIKRKVGYMTQKFTLYEDLTVRENLDFVARLYQTPGRRKAVEESLKSSGLLERREQLAGTLSGGWKQRLSLAACLIHQPELLLLDEPTAGVDPKARREFWETLHALAAERGIAVLISTHFMDEAERCHRLAYIAYGKLLAQGTVKEVVAGSGLTTWELEGEGVHALLKPLSEKPGVSQAAAFGNALHASGTDAKELEKALSSCAGKCSMRKVETRLEDVFIHLMQSAKDDFK